MSLGHIHVDILMDIRTALTLEIGQLNRPVVTGYHVGLLLFRLYQTKSYKGEELSRIRKELPERSDYLRTVKDLLRRGVLTEEAPLRGTEVFGILGRQEPAAGEVACTVDPFAYVSHMSAMEWHGLTERVPKLLFVSSPPPREWRRFALERMRKDLPGDEFLMYRSGKLPELRRLRIDKIGRTHVNRHASLHPGAFISVRDRSLRVSTVGRTFLDMIREPDLCGGIYHVLEIFGRDAPRYLQLIVDEIDRHGTKIDKVRAGYILEERCDLTHPVIQGWTRFAQRGGSRKLSAHNPYSPVFSEKWCLSINIEE